MNKTALKFHIRKRRKGCGTYIIKQKIQLKHYLDCLLNKATFRGIQNISKSYLLTLTMDGNKCVFRGKPHPVFSLPYGHY